MEDDYRNKRGLGGDRQERDDDTVSMYSADDTMSLSMNPESGDNLYVFLLPSYFTPPRRRNRRQEEGRKKARREGGPSRPL